MNKRIKKILTTKGETHRGIIYFNFFTFGYIDYFHVLKILKIYLALLLFKCESWGGLVNFLILVLEKDKIIKQSTTRHKHVTIIAKVVLVVEVNLFYSHQTF